MVLSQITEVCYVKLERFGDDNVLEIPIEFYSNPHQWSQALGSEMGFVHRVARLSLRDRVRNSE